jgi:hypothetical protein
MQAGDRLKSQNVKFMDENANEVVEVPYVRDETRSNRDIQDASLGDFLSRPIVIHEQDWSTTTMFYADFDPWERFITNKRVANRLSNFYMMQGRLHLKFVVNGNGFHFGRAIAAYLPMAAYDQATGVSVFSDGPPVQLSQCPKVFLNPTTNGGGELVLPFFHYKDYANLINGEVSDLGRIYMRALNILRHANGATDTASVKVFAWMTEVAMSGLTSHNLAGLTAQAGDEVDEANAKGVVSGPASAVASVAGSLASVPLIAPYARATQALATGVASVAKTLGYSRPAVTKAPDPMKPKFVGSLALTNTPDLSDKLTMDDKQELSIDPGLVGIGREDTMSISNIACRESYLTRFGWEVGEATDTLLFNIRVNPTVHFEEPEGPKWLPAVSAASTPFRYWTGTMKYRFQVVASNYHKGRLKIVYDPNHLTDTPEYNVNYVKIIDLAESSDFTIEVPMSQPYTWMLTRPTGLTSSSEYYSTSRYTESEELFDNGVLGVYVLNPLTIPNSLPDNDVPINVYVSAGNDFEVAVPSDHYMGFNFVPQSGGETDKTSLDQLDAPVIQDKTEPMTSFDGSNDKIAHVFMGERVSSFRQLIKRFTLHERIGWLGSANDVLSIRRCAFPYHRGPMPGAVHVTSEGGWNLVNMLPIHWVTAMHSGYRGSVRYKFLPHGLNLQSFTAELERDAFPGAIFNTSHSPVDAAVSDVLAARLGVFRSLKTSEPTRPLIKYTGGTYTPGQVSPILEAEIPCYMMERFIPAKWLNWTAAPPAMSDMYGYFARFEGLGSSTAYIDLHVAAGEDFQPYFFTGLPPVVWRSSAPDP